MQRTTEVLCIVLLLNMLLTIMCGLTGQTTHRGGLGLGGSVIDVFKLDDSWTPVPEWAE